MVSFFINLVEKNKPSCYIEGLIGGKGKNLFYGKIASADFEILKFKV